MTTRRTAAEVPELESARRQLAGVHGRRFWRSLNELSGAPDFRAWLEREFPEQADVLDDPQGRRTFLKLMGASLAFAGLSGCTRQPKETILPYARMPEEVVPGKPLWFATAVTLGGVAHGVLVESHLGRPTKIEGNPDHPASLGATDAMTQASILGLYDPDRSGTVLHLGEILPYADFLAAFTQAMEAQKETGGAGLRILTETVTSPSLAAQVRDSLKLYPGARWHQYEPANRDNARAGALAAYGRDVATHHRCDEADVLLALDSDLLGAGPAAVRHARQFADRRRRALDGNGQRPRLYVAEPTPTPTGSMADHRLPLGARHMAPLARALARALGMPGIDREAVPPEVHAHQAWIEAAASDLQLNRGRSVVVTGDGQPAEVHALVHAINHALGNIGRTVVHTEPVEAEPVNQTESLSALVNDMRTGKVSLLLILGGNPAYNAPADLDLPGAMESVGLRIHLSPYADETSAHCHWHVPESHDLESWGDARASDGTITIRQPLIEPLYNGRSAHEILAAAQGNPGRSAYDIVQSYWRERFGEAGFSAAWSRALHDGLVGGSALAPVRVLPRPLTPATPAAPAEGDLELLLRPDPAVHDGRFANNGWLQEMPKPISKLTWDNAALLAPSTAQRLGVASEDVVVVAVGERSVEVPVWIQPGQATDTLTLHLGYGRERAGRVGSGTGVNAYPLRTVTAPWGATGVRVQPTGTRYPLATTQEHHSMEGRHLVRHATLSEYEHHPDFAQHVVHEPGPEMTLYPAEHKYEGHAWGMTIDLDACTGCNACMVACQSENNIPVVGKEQVIAGREMHWIRVDRYYEGDPSAPDIHHQPVLCMHCENAPCELVCPVAATVHSSEGLNDMVYNRCVGTRYCSNNCPYKVRRFNFLQYTDWDTPSLKLQRNPDVSVRSRGVMEKCSYCVQRINGARIDARKEGRHVRDGEIVTACQQSCPTNAIVFGDINDQKSEVAELKADSRNYGILTELNTRPRTTYLASVSNPNPDMDEEA